MSLGADFIQATKRSNLEVHRLPVERCQALGQQFDKIVCTGVLHHLADPDAGLRALRGVLKPDGAMHLMVYATYGRTGVYMLQEYCRQLGVGRSDQEILDLANTLMALPPGHPLAPLLGEAHDFKTKAGLADALLHPQDRAYTVPQVLSFIKRAGLAFGRWLRQASYLPQCGALAKSPHGSRLLQLSPEAQYAAVELFRGTMVRHNAVVYQGDQAARAQTIRFDNETWVKYVPIRLPQTRCIEDRLPPGAAAVLLNQNHTDSDLILPIDELQKRLFEAIDGQKSIVEIIDRVASMGNNLENKEQVRTFFKRLWWYDQVVFDASV